MTEHAPLADAMTPRITQMLGEKFPGQEPSLVSSTNHVVLSYDDRTLAKFGNTESWDPVAESALLTASGIPATVHWRGGEPLLLMDRAGEDITDAEYAAGLSEIAQTLKDIHHNNGLSHLRLPSMTKERVAERLLRRNIGAMPTHVREWFAAAMSRLPDLPAAGESVVHTDPHPGNWVRGDRGHLLPIDWESACRGHPEADVAGVLHACTARSLDYAPFLDAYGPFNSEILVPILTAKTISAAAHQAWSKGVEAFDERRQGPVRSLRQDWDLPLPD